MLPASTMTIDSTDAKIGRLMKNVENTGQLSITVQVLRAMLACGLAHRTCGSAASCVRNRKRARTLLFGGSLGRGAGANAIRAWRMRRPIGSIASLADSVNHVIR